MIKVIFTNLDTKYEKLIQDFITYIRKCSNEPVGISKQEGVISLTVGKKFAEGSGSVKVGLFAEQEYCFENLEEKDELDTFIRRTKEFLKANCEPKDFPFWLRERKAKKVEKHDFLCKLIKKQ